MKTITKVKLAVAAVVIIVIAGETKYIIRKHENKKKQDELEWYVDELNKIFKKSKNGKIRPKDSEKYFRLLSELSNMEV